MNAFLLKDSIPISEYNTITFENATKSGIQGNQQDLDSQQNNFLIKI